MSFAARGLCAGAAHRGFLRYAPCFPISPIEDARVFWSHPHREITATHAERAGRAGRSPLSIEGNCREPKDARFSRFQSFLCRS